MKQILDMTLPIHEGIIRKLDYFINVGKIPNIIFHGESGSGKRTIVNNFIKKIYNNDKDLLKCYVMDVNCAHGKGIKFIREELKFFAKTHIGNSEKAKFKCIILANADCLTIDAQSALRRCIELFSHTTRFFIIVEDKYRLLRPILSRFCEIFVSRPIIKNIPSNLHSHLLLTQNFYKKYDSIREVWLKKYLNSIKPKDGSELLVIVSKLYEKAYSGLDILNYIENSEITNLKKYQYLITYNKIRNEFRNEKLLILFMLNFLYLRSELDLENMSFI